MQGEMNNVVEKAVELLKFDPNYAGGNDDEDEEMGGVSDDEDLDDEYDDEDDTSWRVRRSAAKLLATCISTRPDLLSHFYKTVSPALIARFGDREETVKVEVWTTYTLNSQTPNIVRSIVKQLNAKSLATRQAGFVLLHELISVLDGGLESQIPQLVGRVETALKSTDSGLSGAATSLKIEVLSLLALFFRTHHLKTFTDDLPKLVPLLVSAINDRFNKIAAEAFITSSSLIKALRPVTPTVSTLAPSLVAHLTAIYQATMQRLIGPDADEEVKGKGIQTLGTLLYHAGDYAAGDLAAALSFLRDRLKIEVQRIVAVQTVGQVASSPVCRGDELDAWVRDCLAEVSPLFRKVHRPLKIAAFECIDALLARAAAAGVPTETSSALLTDLQPLLTDQDVNLLPHALNTVATLLSIDPLSSTEIDDSILPRIFELVQSPLVQGPSLEGLLTFFQAYIKAGANPKPLLKKLGASADGVKKSVEASGTQSGMQSLVTASRCIGMIMKECPDVGEDVIIENEEVVKSANSSPAALILSLLTLGEVGRIIEFGSHQPVFARIVEHFSAESEDVRRSAAFSAGNIAVGNKEAFLPTILQLIQSDDKKRYLALQALKEVNFSRPFVPSRYRAKSPFALQVILHSSPESLAAISDQLWTPLFENCEAQEEGIRNIAADCLGHLTVSNPAKYLPQLQARLSSDSRHTRATVIAALRFTFTNDSTTYDELLAPLIVEFFKLMHDPDLGVRRLALASLNSAAHNKPHLVRDHLSTLLPELYAQTVVDESLIRIVEMGPRVIAGLSDEEEVKKLCYVMLVKLAQVAPTAVTQRLDETVPAFTETLGVVLKDNATKQEAERTLELQKSTIRCIAVLNPSTPKFSTYISTVVANGKMAGELKEAMKLSQTVAMDLD
ncbi:SPOSA6832_02353 [Sporobolomyces salmonicolor]|uniref:SPOSA6832_02353-mRNA-1:cds n=1 Tax=Sporidiobolus salmonicolor TaxID=5005 RepID=A0A0D6ELF1_SPOSA|nr:SPOSA6832_02353 [Sporobolomyces salmonicolor]